MRDTFGIYLKPSVGWNYFLFLSVNSSTSNILLYHTKFGIKKKGFQGRIYSLSLLGLWNIFTVNHNIYESESYLFILVFCH